MREQLDQPCACGCNQPAHAGRNGYRNACYLRYRKEHGKPPPRPCEGGCGKAVQPAVPGERPPRRCPDCRPGHKLRQHRARTYRTKLRQRGATLADVERFWREQDGKCGICRCQLQQWSPESSGGSAHLDHCHATGRLRGLLCARCNHAIGLLDDDVERILRAARYIAGTKPE